MRSPSRGDLMGGADPQRLAGIYEKSGAEAVSVVVEEKYFGGSPELFEHVRESTALPLLWKDFVVDSYQVRLAAALGASAVLLIVGLVPDENLRALLNIAREEGLIPLVEVHGEGDLPRALAAGADLVGVNNRDLVSLEVDPRVSEKVSSLIPRNLRAIAESGMKNPQDVRRMADLGFRAVLVGEALVTAKEPGALLGEMVKAGKR
jgi:indole-3-glycerol phosphate synthase